jgi:hypothetical protein
MTFTHTGTGAPRRLNVQVLGPPHVGKEVCRFGIDEIVFLGDCGY